MGMLKYALIEKPLPSFTWLRKTSANLGFCGKFVEVVIRL